MFISAYCPCSCVLRLSVSVCIQSVGVFVCEQKVHQPINRNRRLSTLLELEICHPEEKASVWLVQPDYLCQQYSSLFPACGGLLIFGSFEAEKRENTSVSVLTSTLRGLSGGLCSLVSQVCTRWDCKWAEVSRYKRWFGCPQRHTEKYTHTLKYRRNNFGWMSTQVNS